MIHGEFIEKLFRELITAKTDAETKRQNRRGMHESVMRKVIASVKASKILI